jgi:hypothetical protein
MPGRATLGMLRMVRARFDGESAVHVGDMVSWWSAFVALLLWWPK